MSVLPMFMRPLHYLAWEPEFRSSNLPENSVADELLTFLCPHDVHSDISDFRKRYEAVSKHDRSLLMSFPEPELQENVFGLLRQAKTNYVVGNYVGSIMLCGVVAERVAILVHAINTPCETERRSFQALGQKRRVDCLKRRKLVGNQSMQDFGNIRTARNSKSHDWTIPDASTAKLAVRMYSAATRLVVDMMDVSFEEGRAILNQEFRDYLMNPGGVASRETKPRHRKPTILVRLAIKVCRSLKRT